MENAKMMVICPPVERIHDVKGRVVVCSVCRDYILLSAAAEAAVGGGNRCFCVCCKCAVLILQEAKAKHEQSIPIERFCKN